jgi:hypothetical protein
VPLVQSLEMSFGTKLDLSDQNFIVSSAKLLKHFLKEKGYKCADEVVIITQL